MIYPQKRKKPGRKPLTPEERCTTNVFERMSINTIMRHNQIYTDYKKLRKDVERDFPEMVEYINIKFYYQVIASRHSLTKNHTMAIVHLIDKNKALFDKSLRKAYKRIEEDEWI